MAKDPAFLFYSSDFLTGVIDMTMEERGQYITLMCLQHQKGHLSLETIRFCVGNISDKVLNKYRQDDNGLYFNSRLDSEILKRDSFVESRQNNGKKGGRPPKDKTGRFSVGLPTDNLPENENENENEDINKAANETEERTPRVKKDARHKYGDYGWVVLTDAEYEKLLNDLGKPELDRCIRYIDESAQSTGNKNKWKDWNLVVRRCSKMGWGKNHSYSTDGGVGNGISSRNTGTGFKPSTGFKRRPDEER